MLIYGHSTGGPKLQGVKSHPIKISGTDDPCHMGDKSTPLISQGTDGPTKLKNRPNIT